MTKDTFKDNAYKKEINNTLVKVWKQLGLGKAGYAVVLESEKMRTVTALKRAGFLEKNIEIPNNNLATYKKIVKKHRQTYYMSLGEYLDTISIPENKYSLSLVFADYCGTIDGNKDTCPLEDIRNLFETKLMKKSSVLAVTFSTHNGKKPNKLQLNDISRMGARITMSAYENGYVATELPFGRRYNNSMYFTIYQIHPK